MSDGWPTVPIGSLLTDIQPGFASGSHNSDGVGIPHFRPMNVSAEGVIEREVVKYVDPSVGRADVRLVSGDILFNNTNSPELVGKTALFEGVDSPAFSNHMTRLRVNEKKLDARFAALRLHQAWREGWFAAHCNNHVSQASIGRDVLKSFEIELPPLDVQQAIACLSKGIDTSRSSATGHLTAARRAIERFRQAILAAACCGSLTVDWREAHPDLVSVEQALTDLAERHRTRAPRDSELFDLTLPDVPASYMPATIRSAASIIEYGTSKKADVAVEGIPVLRMGNIQDGQLNLDELKYCKPDRETEGLLLQDGDLLFNRTNSPELVGKTAVFHESASMTFASYLIRVRFAPDLADPDFVSFWINSAWGKAWARHVKTDGVSQSNINGTKLGAMPIPLPPIQEQREIVRRASQILRLGDELLARVEATRRRIDLSSQALLTKAFRGELNAALGANS